MDFWQDTNWFAVQTKPHQEKLAAARLAQLDLEVFLPRVRKHELIGGAPRWLIRPLFPGYLFSRFRPLLSYEAVRYVSGVVRVVGSHRSPIPVAPDLIASIQERQESDGFIRLQPRSLRAGELVTIEQGPLAGWMGRVEREWDDHRRVAILLDTLQQMRVLVDAERLAVVAV